MPFSVGTTIGPYRIMEQLGQGGMATVYKAYHASLDRYVAIKVLHPAFKEDQNFLSRFEREARVVAKLEHPNIVPIYDYAEHEGQPYLVMKYIEGETLKARLQRGPLSGSEVQHIVESIGAGLAYAHKRNILHRDIKPSNVILENDGGIYLADFGLARIAQGSESTLTSDVVLGTPQYISPEQALGKKDLDNGTDIYSFGVMIYEMTVGRVPFSADTPFSVIHDHIYAPLPMPSDVNPTISSDLERFLLKSLAKDRADRYKDVGDMVATFIEAWRDSTTTTQVKPVSPAMKEPATAPTEKSASAPMTVLQQPAPPVTESQETTFQSAAPRPRKYRWMWVALVVLLSLCCLVVFWATRNRGVAGNAGAQNAATPAVPASTTVDNSAGVQFEAIVLEQVSIEEAQRLKEENPDDPRAGLLLGAVLIEAGEFEDGYSEIHDAADLAAESDQPGLLIGGGRALQERGLWLAAAIMYHRAYERAPVALSPVAENLLETIYFAYQDPRAPQYLEFGDLADSGEYVSLFAQARYTLVNRNPEDAEPLVERLLAEWPQAAEARLLEAELLLAQQQTRQANVVLEQLLTRENIPMWVMNRATELKSQIQ